MEIVRIKSQWREKKGFSLNRPDTAEEVIFVHFLTPAETIENGQKKPIPAGSCIFYGKHSAQFFCSPDCDLIHDWFHAVGDVESRMEHYQLQFNTFYHPQPDGFISEIIRSLEFEILGARAYQAEICACRTEELLARIARGCLPPPDARWDPPTVQQFLELRVKLNAQFRENWTVEQMASELNLSPSRFHFLYQSIFHISPKRDLNNMRLEHAKELLQTTNVSISDISSQVGYSSAGLMIRQFRKQTGQTPQQWRLQLKK